MRYIFDVTYKEDEEMKLVIGGRAQGKLNYVLQHMTDENYQIYDGVFPDEGELFNLTRKNEWLIVNHFHKKSGRRTGGFPEKRCAFCGHQ